MGDYQALKRWRKKAKNKEYAAKYMRDQRIYYRQLFLKGKIKCEDVPKAYCYWKCES